MPTEPTAPAPAALAATAYLDHAGSSPVRPEVAAAVVEVLEAVPGNPSGSHRWAREARRRLDDARDTVAALVGAEPGEVVFTSGGTEADNLAIVGTLHAHPDKRSTNGSRYGIDPDKPPKPKAGEAPAEE